MVLQLVRQLVYSMFISNNSDSLHFWWQEHLVKHEKVLKHFENGGVQKRISRIRLQAFLFLCVFINTSNCKETVMFRLEFTLSF